MPVVQPTSYRKNNNNNEAPKTSGSDAAVREVNEIKTVAQNISNMRIPAEYSDTQVRRALESDLDNMLKVMFPNRGVRFKIHESGNIIINIVDNETDEIIREIPSEKILDIIHSMTQRIGAITNKRM